ncbi:translation initiation factor 1 [Enteropsectra breve]|nr:translation initiation factor 1 [Enteropsectra breve]
MDLNFSENVVQITIKKFKNSYTTLIQNLPKERLDKILSTCRTKFGCGGSVVKDTTKPSILLQGDHKFNIEKFRNTIFEGLELKLTDK